MWEFFLAISYHIGAVLGYDFNEVHPHVRYTHEEKYIAGVYYNSERNVSFYGGYDFGYVEAGLVTGYSDGPVVPFVRAKYNGFYVSPALYGEERELGLVVGYEIKL